MRLRFRVALLLVCSHVCSHVPLEAQKTAHQAQAPARERGHMINDPGLVESFRKAMAAAPSTGNGISYHGGPVMTTPVHMYYIWYGNWHGNDAIALLENFANNLGGTPYFNTNSTYTDGSGAAVANSVQFGGSTLDNYSQGSNLSDAQIWQVVSSAITSGKFPADPDGVYFVLSSADVGASSGFCSYYCGWHTYGSLGGTNIKFAFVGDAARCPSGCSAQQTSPNGNVGADAMASIIAHELNETVTDPELNAWFDSRGGEDGDKCAWSFGVTVPAANGSRANITLGQYSYLIQQNWLNVNGGSCAMRYVVPTLSAMSPAKGAAGTAVPVTLTGANFGVGANLSISGSGVTTSNLAVVSPTQITATLNVAAGAAPGVYNVTVTMGAAVSATVPFNVTSTAPQLTSISPVSGFTGGTVPVTLTGSNFAAGATVQVSGSGVSGVAVSGVTVTSPTQITARLAIDRSAAVGSRNVTVTVGSSVSSPVVFAVASSAVAFTSVTPGSGAPGKTVPVTIAGTNFAVGAAVQISGAGVSASAVSVVSPTQITAMIGVDKTATAGARNMTVLVGGNVSNAVNFSVASVAPAVTSLSVATGLAGTIVPVTLTGTNFAPGAAVALSGAGVTAGAVTVLSASQITAQFAIDKSAAAGARNVTVSVGGAVSSPVSFTVTQPVSFKVTGMNPGGMNQGMPTNVAVTGTGFLPGSGIAVSGTGITVSQVQYWSPTLITAAFTADANATLGARSVTVTASTGSSAPLAFVVNPAGPVVSSVTPSSGTLGSTVTMTLKGSGFTPDSFIVANGTGVTIGKTVVVSSSQMTVQLTLNGATGQRFLLVVIPSARYVITSTPVYFTITAAGAR